MAEFAPWKRPEPGTPTVFLSYHARDREAAKATSAALQDLGVRVWLYSPTERWLNATLELLQRILNEAQLRCLFGTQIVQESMGSVRTRVRKETRHSGSPRASSNRAPSIVPEIQLLSELPPTEPWPIFIEKYMDEAMRGYPSAYPSSCRPTSRHWSRP